MEPLLRIALVIGVIVYMAFIIVLLRKKRLSLKYSLLWMFTAVVLLAFAIFPGIVTAIARLLGIYSVVNAIYLVIVFFMLLLLISLTSIVSKQNRQIRTLVQQVAIIEKRLRELEK